jgi:hypothetical protein
MPRLQDAIAGLARRAWQGRSNPLLLTPLHFAPESRLQTSSVSERSRSAIAFSISGLVPTVMVKVAVDVDFFEANT